MSNIAVRWTDPEGEAALRAEIIRQSWHDSYRDLFSPAQIDAVFDGRTGLDGSWTHRRLGAAGTLMADVDGIAVGLASLALLRQAGRGELAALYVRSGRQGIGVGSALWSAAQAALRERGCSWMEVWTLARAEARHFYEARGAVPIGEGTVEIADQVEMAVGYEVGLRTRLITP